jgi:hypothetical protein
MSAEPTRKASPHSAAQIVRKRVLRNDARFWKHSDFRGLPPAAVATELSRLRRDGELERISKGIYYRAVPTSFGASLPSATAAAAAAVNVPLCPAGLSAANMLGLSTQNPGRAEYAVPGRSRPAALAGSIIHTGRPVARRKLSGEDGAILELLRERGRSSDLPPKETVRRIKQLLADVERYQRLADAAFEEPPRVRAMLGALGQELEMPAKPLEKLRDNLNPLSRFDFGVLRTLRHAPEWQAK